MSSCMRGTQTEMYRPWEFKELKKPDNANIIVVSVSQQLPFKRPYLKDFVASRFPNC